MSDAAVVFRFAIAFVFVVAAVPKLLDLRGFEAAVENYALLPTRLVRPVTRALPWVELISAGALIVGVAVAPIALLASLLLLAFATAISVNLLRGRRIDCGCQGTIAPRTLSWPLVLRDVALAAMAIITGLVNPHVFVAYGSGGYFHGSSLSGRDGLALVAVAAFVVIAELLASSWAQLRVAARSLEEFRSHEEVAV